MALALTMLILLVVMAAALIGAVSSSTSSTVNSGAMTVSNGTVQMANARLQATTAFNLAESGIEFTLQWLNSLPAAPSSAKAFDPTFTWGDTTNPFPAASTNGQGFLIRKVVTDPFSTGDTSNTFSVVIYPSTGNLGNTQKKYLVESIGSSGGLKQIVEAYVQESSFGKYAVFINDTPPNSYWGSGLNVFDGPVHSNNAVNAANGQANLNNVLWSDGTLNGDPVAPVFTWQGVDAFTVSGSGVNWWRNTVGNTTPAPSTAEMSDILSFGSGGFHTNTQAIAFPPSAQLTRQHDAALNGATAPAAGDPVGVTVPTGGGLYIHGDVQQMELTVQGSKQVITIDQTDSNNNPYTTTVTLNPSPSPGTTQVQVNYMAEAGHSGNYHPATTNANYSGITNGVIYCDGNIGGQTGTKTGGLAGQVADKMALTVATDPGMNLNIDGDLKYKTARQVDGNGNPIPESQDSNFVNNAGTLGIVSNTVEVVDDYGSGDWEGKTAGNAITSLEVDAAVLAYNTYDACDYLTRPAGLMLNMGTYLVKTRGLFATSNNNVVVTGISCNRRYDARLANTPPPYFPTTSTNYDVLSWQRVAQTLQQ